MTGGERNTAKSKNIRTRETKQKGVWGYAHWLLMQSTLVVDALCIDVESLVVEGCALVADVLYTGC